MPTSFAFVAAVAGPVEPALDLAYRGDDGGGAAGECFIQLAARGVRAPLVHRIAFLAETQPSSATMTFSGM
jgi:hypothetical protein